MSLGIVFDDPDSKSLSAFDQLYSAFVPINVYLNGAAPISAGDL